MSHIVKIELIVKDLAALAAAAQSIGCELVHGQQTHKWYGRYLRLLQDHYKNLAVPISTLLFGIIGMPLGIVIKRSGRAGGFAVGILIVVLFYVLNVIADYWVSSRALNPFAAAWFPDIVFGLACLWLFNRRARA